MYVYKIYIHIFIDIEILKKLTSFCVPDGKSGRDLRVFKVIFKDNIKRSVNSNFQTFIRKSCPPIDFQKCHCIN